MPIEVNVPLIPSKAYGSNLKKKHKSRASKKICAIKVTFPSFFSGFFAKWIFLHFFPRYANTAVRMNARIFSHAFTYKHSQMVDICFEYSDSCE